MLTSCVRMPAYPEDSGSGSEYEDDQNVKAQSRKRGRGVKATASKRARHDTMESDMTVTDATLFEIVRQGRMAMTAVVDDWIEAYKADRNGSLLDLIQFFIHAAGCKGSVTPQMLREATEGFQEVIKKMTEEFDEDSGDYPLIAAGSHFRKFRSSFCDFVQALVRQCQYQIIYDQFMMDNILTLLTELSNSQVRAFRHTSTLAAMKLMTGLVNVALQLSVSLDNTQRQYDAERNKAMSKRASEKLDILLQKRKELEEQQSEIESMLNGIFKGIFVHRYRDYIADIRALCMEEIGIWMKMFPKVFLTDSYLKYVGWTLHDKQKEVRSKCLNTLIGLYSDTEMTRDLKLFTSRFKDRIVSMTLDKEYDVAVLAIKLLVLILVNCGYDTPVLTTSDCESVYQLVFSCHRPVALAAAEFLNKQLFMDKEVTPGYTKRGRRRSPNAPLIADLVMFFIESELHEHATYLVDSLWDVASGMLKDWECMSDMLLEEPANDRDALDERQESALVDIMVCSVKQAAEGAPPSGRQGYSKKSASKDRKTAIEDKVRLTEHFIVALPNLLKKYHVDKEKVACLLQIPRYFDLEFYTTSRLEKHLDDLLAQMAIVIDKHADSEVLEQASRTYYHLCDDDYTIYSKVAVAKRSVIDTWSENFRLALDIFKEAGDEADEEEVYNVTQSLKRLTYLYMFNDLTGCELHSQVNSIIQMHQERTDSIPESMLRQAVKFIYYDLVYGLVRVKDQSEGGAGGGGAEDPRAAISQLRQRVTEYLRSCEALLMQSPHKKVQEASYMSICDLLVMFAPQLANACPTLKPLVQRAPDQLQHALLDFVRDFVFVMPEEDDDEDDTAKIDALHRRRSLLAALCKLFVFSMIDLKLAAFVFQQYIRFYSDYGDIIKETISRSRHISKLACAQTLALSLMTLFRDTVREQGGELDHSSQEYGHMKELARRFALTFGLDQVKTRDAVAELHKEGILFALKREDGAASNESEAPPNLSFLGILVEFSAKLMRQDKKTVVQYLDRHINHQMLSNQDQSWIPLVTYRNSLLQGADDEQRPAPAKSRRARRRKNEGDFEAPATPGPATPLQQPQTPMTPQPMQQPMTPQNTMGHPQMTSTVLRGMQGIPDTHQQPHIPEDHSLQYQPDSLRAWLNSEQKTSKQRSKSGSRSYEARSCSGDKKKGSSAKKASRGKTDEVAALKRSQSTPRKRHRETVSEDEGFGGDEVEGEGTQRKSAHVRRSRRSKSKTVLSYAEASDDAFESSPPATWGQARADRREEEQSVSDREGVKTARGSRRKRKAGLADRILFDASLNEEELAIDDFDDDNEISECGEGRSGGESPKLPLLSCSTLGLIEPSQEQSNLEQKSTQQEVSAQSERRSPDSDVGKDEFNDDLFTMIDSSINNASKYQHASSEVVAANVAKLQEDFSHSSLASSVKAKINNPFKQIVSKVKQKANVSSAQDSDADQNILDVSSDEGSLLSSDEFQSPVKLSANSKLGCRAQSSDSSAESDDYESVDEENLALQIMQGRENVDYKVKRPQFRPSKSSQMTRLTQDDDSSDDGELGEFQDVVDELMFNISQRSQLSSQTSDLTGSGGKMLSAPAMASESMVMTQTPQSMQATPVPDYQSTMNVGYPMNAPQPSPIPQMSAPQHPGMQYMHPSTPAGLYQHGTNDPFQGVMSPMQQLGMPAQSPYYGN